MIYDDDKKKNPSQQRLFLEKFVKIPFWWI